MKNKLEIPKKAFSRLVYDITQEYTYKAIKDYWYKD